MDNTLQFVREGSVSYQSIPLLLAAAVWGGAKEMGLGEVGAQRGLVTAQATQPAGAERGLGPSLHPLPVNLRAAGGGIANECVCGGSPLCTYQEGSAEYLLGLGSGVCRTTSRSLSFSTCHVRVCLPLGALSRL